MTKLLQVEAYIRKKEAREEAIKREKKEIKVLKEEKQMRLLRQRENQMGQEDEQDALRAKQAQEATEREWRRKEREAQLRNSRKWKCANWNINNIFLICKLCSRISSKILHLWYGEWLFCNRWGILYDFEYEITK